MPDFTTSDVTTLGGIPVERHYTNVRLPANKTVPVKTSSAAAFYRPCVRWTFTDLAPGDVLIVDAASQITTTFDHPVMVGSYIKVGESYLAHPVEHASEVAPGWKWNSERMTMNVLLDVHHMPSRGTATLVVPELIPDGTVYIQHVLYALASNADPGDELVLDYTELTVTVLRANSALAEAVADHTARLTVLEDAVAVLQTASATQAAGISALAAADSVHTASLADHEGRLLTLEA